MTKRNSLPVDTRSMDAAEFRASPWRYLKRLGGDLLTHAFPALAVAALVVVIAASILQTAGR